MAARLQCRAAAALIEETIWHEHGREHGTSGRLARNDTAVVTSRSSSYARHLAREPSVTLMLLVSLSFAPYAILLAVRCAGCRERCWVPAATSTV